MMLFKTTDGAVYGKVVKQDVSSELDGYITVEAANSTQKVLYKTEDGKVYGVR